MNKRILILDDDDAFREDLAELLVNEGYDVADYGDARTLPINRICASDILLLDLSMPGCDGAQVLKRVADCRGTTSVILISGSDEDVIRAVADAARLRSVDLRGTLSKPFDPQELLRMVAMVEAPLPCDHAAAPRIPRDKLATALAGALDARTLAVTFQPKMNARTLRFAGAEVLLGNMLPGVGLVPPPAVITAASQCDHLLSRLTFEIFRSAVRGQRVWTAAGHAGPVSVNVPLDVLLEPDTAIKFSELARAVGCESRDVICELTEDALYDSSSDSLIALAQMRLAGFGLALDDVGQRQSGLLQLARLPVTELKIDMELLRQARTSQKARSIFTSLVELGHRLSMKVVAEGVETLEDLQFARADNVDFVQGYLLSPKRVLEDLIDFLAAWPEQQQALQRAAVGDTNGRASAEPPSRTAGG